MNLNRHALVLFLLLFTPSLTFGQSPDERRRELLEAFARASTRAEKLTIVAELRRMRPESSPCPPGVPGNHRPARGDVRPSHPGPTSPGDCIGPAQEPAAQPRAMCPFVLSFGVGREFTVDTESKWEPFVWTASSCHMLMEARESKHSPPTNSVGKLGLVLSRS